MEGLHVCMLTVLVLKSPKVDTMCLVLKSTIVDLQGASAVDYTVCRQKSPRCYILNLLLMVEIKSALGRKLKKNLKSIWH